MRISDWSSDVRSSDLKGRQRRGAHRGVLRCRHAGDGQGSRSRALLPCIGQLLAHPGRGGKLRLACEWRHRPDTFADTERRFGEQRWRLDDIEYRTNPSRRFESRELRLVDHWLTLRGDGPQQLPYGRGVLYQQIGRADV